ncbi:Nif3-like dinuclear metal center hexameric protein [Ferrimonas aestuarii]|uniref:GTP cyclohydrolase 1 type 2 homolog n=1 Tax=Ferrimonas aestuarii TaxID=2569539 RepID=A0A4U1BRN1_9GAMM|nr:Nif3-like dinuclear metal center hexameric protein [Ferrimonas aestuarii]
MISREQLLNYLTDTLQPHRIKDYAPNGLQVEGTEEITKIVTAVTASQSVIDAAIELGADAVLVHHGYFWKGEAPELVGMKQKRIKALLEHDINLMAYHLPLDIHPEFGNNAMLAKELGLTITGPMELGNELSVAVCAEFAEPQPASEFVKTIERCLGRKPLHIGDDCQLIKSVGLCSGGAQDYIDLAANRGMDAFLSGEVSERTYYSAVEQGIHYFAAGHHATERSGIRELGKRIAAEFGVEVVFVDAPNPV